MILLQKKHTLNKLLALFALVTALLLSVGCSSLSHVTQVDSLPSYSGNAYEAVNNNTPYFTEKELTARSFERYSPLDLLGRCGTATACIGVDIMPTEERGNIGQVKPSGWHTVKYDFVDGKYLYNRCHLIGYQLAGENANERNLITGTRYMNVQGMLPFENMVADYVKETENHVLYRVTPIYDGNNLLASGVIMEAYSVEDDGDGICFNVYVFNVQPGVDIDHTTGESKLSESFSSDIADFVLNKSSKKFHLPSCSSVSDIKEKNREYYTGSRRLLILQGYNPCKACNP